MNIQQSLLNMTHGMIYCLKFVPDPRLKCGYKDEGVEIFKIGKTVTPKKRIKQHNPSCLPGKYEFILGVYDDNIHVLEKYILSFLDKYNWKDIKQKELFCCDEEEVNKLFGLVANLKKIKLFTNFDDVKQKQKETEMSLITSHSEPESDSALDCEEPVIERVQVVEPTCEYYSTSSDDTWTTDDESYQEETPKVKKKKKKSKILSDFLMDGEHVRCYVETTQNLEALRGTFHDSTGRIHCGGETFTLSGLYNKFKSHKSNPTRPNGKSLCHTSGWNICECFRNSKWIRLNKLNKLTK